MEPAPLCVVIPIPVTGAIAPVYYRLSMIETVATSMPEPEILSRQSLPEQIKDRLLAQITSGALQPGDRLIELRIAEEMETSQAPVREALRELEAIGVVETIRNKGSRVRAITPEELGEIYDLRAELEGFAAELAASGNTAIGPALAQQVEAMRDAARANDTLAFADANTAFHREIVEAAGNSILLEHWEQLDVQFRSALNMTRRELDLAQTAESHLAIVEAITDGAATGARTAARAHVLDNKPAA